MKQSTTTTNGATTDTTTTTTTTTNGATTDTTTTTTTTNGATTDTTTTTNEPPRMIRQLTLVETAEDVWEISGKLTPRTLVAVYMPISNNGKKPKPRAYQLRVKIKNSDKLSLMKALVKSTVIAKRVFDTKNAEQPNKDSQNYGYDLMAAFLGCHYLYLVNNRGELDREHEIAPIGINGPATLKTLVRFRATSPITVQVIEPKHEPVWDNPVTAKCITDWAKASLNNIAYVKDLDRALYKHLIKSETAVTETVDA